MSCCKLKSSEADIDRWVKTMDAVGVEKTVLVKEKNEREAHDRHC